MPALFDCLWRPRPDPSEALLGSGSSPARQWVPYGAAYRTPVGVPLRPLSTMFPS